MDSRAFDANQDSEINARPIRSYKEEITNLRRQIIQEVQDMKSTCEVIGSLWEELLCLEKNKKSSFGHIKFTINLRN